MARPTPRSAWEKILMTPVWFLPPALFISSMVREGLGIWAGIGTSAAVIVVGTFILLRLSTPLRKARLARDAERGVIRCTIRHPDALPGSLRNRWSKGIAEVRDDALMFQPLLADLETPTGPIRVFSGPSVLGGAAAPEQRAPGLARRWKALPVGTGQGLIEIAADDSALAALQARLAHGPPSR